jgi:hypothetical protein
VLEVGDEADSRVHMAVRGAAGPSCQRGRGRSRVGAASSFTIRRHAGTLARHIRKNTRFWQTRKISLSSLVNL